MPPIRSTLLFTVLLLGAGSSWSWDPIGDITHPERILRNVGREVGNAGAELDRMRLEANAQAGAPVLEAWLNQSRNNAMRGGTSPIPPRIRQALDGFYDDDLLNRVSFKIGDAGVLNLANLSITYGDAGAVTLVDVVVFADSSDAQSNDELWAHELKHVQQFRDWGVRDFSIRYLRSWNGVEDEAYATQNQYVNWRSQMLSQHHHQPTLDRASQGRDSAAFRESIGNRMGTSQPNIVPPATIQPFFGSATVGVRCSTLYGTCILNNQVGGVGQTCWCPSSVGIVYGSVVQ